MSTPADRSLLTPSPSSLPPDPHAQARLAAIVASSEDAIVSKDLNGIVQSWNGAAERIFGYTAAEMVGTPIHRLIPPERVQEEPMILERLRRGERVEHFRTVRVRRDGRRILVSVTISPVYGPDGTVVGASKIARDITREVELEGLYAAIVAGSDDAIVSKDLNGVVRSWNPGAERIFGYTAAEIVGTPIHRLIPPERADEEAMILSRLRRGERIDHFETVRVRKDGRRIDVSVSISALTDPTGRVIGASKVARDITAFKRLARDREQLLASEQAARRDAERAARTKDEFLATLSHELRTPLNAILGWTQLLRGTEMPPDVADGLETIERNARALTQLVEDLLDMSRIVTAKLRLDVQRVDLPDVVGEAIASVRPAAEAKAIRLHRLLDPQAGPVTGDPTRLRQVVWNLLSNAVKFTPKGGKVEVFLQRVNSHVELTVSDTGQGIEPEFLPQLFARFAQADTATTRRHGGLGLGLAIARHLVELHGGTIRAASPGPGQGATFVVALPLAAMFDHGPDERAHPATAALAPVAPFRLDLSGVRVLVVDDEPDARELVRRVLTNNGATVETAGSAAEGLAAVRRDPPSVLVSDIGMPGEDGYHLLERVRALPPAEGGATPAVALTAFARSEDRRRALLAGFQMHVPKPVESAELLAVIASLAGVTHRAAGGGPTGTA